MREITGTASVETTSSESSRAELTAPAAEHDKAFLSQKEALTKDEAQARVREGEELVWANCSCCNQLLAVYIARDKGCTVDLPRSGD